MSDAMTSQNIDLSTWDTPYIQYTGCFMTLGHNCRRWFPRSLWWKKFI